MRALNENKIGRKRRRSVHVVRTHSPHPLSPVWGSVVGSTIVRSAPVRTAVFYSYIVTKIRLKKKKEEKSKKREKKIYFSCE